MKVIQTLVLVLVLVLVLAAAGSALAGKNTKGFGLGLMAGEPSGLNAKVWTGSNTALVAGAAMLLNDDGRGTGYVDYLWHVHDMTDTRNSIMPFYYGVGARYRAGDGTEDTWGVRIPLGLDYLFGNSSWDVFGELVPIIEVAPDQDFDVNAVVGVRYFF